MRWISNWRLSGEYDSEKVIALEGKLTGESDKSVGRNQDNEGEREGDASKVTSVRGGRRSFRFGTPSAAGDNSYNLPKQRGRHGHRWDDVYLNTIYPAVL